MIPDDLVPVDHPWPVVLGIDPGTIRMGWGAVVVAADGPRLLACGVLHAPARAAIARRLAGLARDVEEVFARLRPSVVALERAFSGKNAAAALRIGEARGVVLAAAGRREIPVTEYPPAVAKKAVLGHGGASKHQVAAMVAIILRSGPIDAPSDATDALAVALAHVQRMGSLEHLAREATS
jgi:crossover junction endodeoxyribonuclease RuvC